MIQPQRRNGAAMPHLVMLDAMRGVAALAVVAFHAHALLTPIDLGHAYLAVDLFFVLSGLVIARAYAARFEAGMGAVEFLRLRLIRLYPLYALGTGFGALIMLLARVFAPSGALATALVAAILMLPAPLPIEPEGRLAPFNVAAWSLLFELGANVLLALLWHRLTPRVLGAIVAGSGLALAVGVFAHGHADVGANWDSALLAIPRTLFSFFLGVLLARRRLPALRPAPVLPMLVLLLATLAAPRSWVMPGYDLVCIMLVFPAMVWLGAGIAPRRETLPRWLGAVSFPVYALHAPLLVAVGPILHRLPPWLVPAPPLLGLIGIGTIIALAWAAGRWFDPMARGWLAMPRRVMRIRPA